ncbi:L,D-transpeptidase [Aureimonas flava]|uniref:L,D-transpeptidase n=1 Tax=Aureimonas flava TaxID=2320271 RepID=A0A3A1WQ83_9HYPH|nr:L,D-transpeptidase [Aureimonas flava]RIY02504.1 L,D-transpeptidase [Aureimonas flava]
MRLLHALCAMSLLGSLALPAEARDRRPLSVPPDVAEPWVRQLSPGSGVVPGYARRHLAPPAAPGTVVFEGNIPVGVIPEGGGPMQPLGAYRAGRAPVVFGQAAPAAPRSAGVLRERRTGAPVFASASAAPARAAASRATRPRGMDPAFLPRRVDYDGGYAPGTIVVDTRAHYLYHVEAGGRAMRYGVGVGKEGFGWSGSHKITRKAEWPGWTPPAEMIARERAKGRILPAHMPGGEENPLGARALYLGSTLYRIHGTNQPWTIGQSVSSGCIRMRNEDVMDLYERVGVGTRVVVL